LRVESLQPLAPFGPHMIKRRMHENLKQKRRNRATQSHNYSDHYRRG
jgi:hypothetical protein